LLARDELKALLDSLSSSHASPPAAVECKEISGRQP
jgi:hypothetical protein